VDCCCHVHSVRNEGLIRTGGIPQSKNTRNLVRSMVEDAQNQGNIACNMSFSKPCNLGPLCMARGDGGEDGITATAH
jgi:hypothetical protein